MRSYKNLSTKYVILSRERTILADAATRQPIPNWEKFEFLAYEAVWRFGGNRKVYPCPQYLADTVDAAKESPQGAFVVMVENGHAIVAYDDDHGHRTPAVNWQELEEEALRVVQSFKSDTDIPHILPCPVHLATKAKLPQ